MDPGKIRNLVAHTPGGGRTDITLIPGGASVWSLGIVEHAQIVRRLGGHLDDIPLTISRDNPARISSAEGGASLRLRLGVEGADLTADTLFPFSQVTLVQTARTLEAWGVQVEVVGIASTPSAVASTGIRRLAA